MKVQRQYPGVRRQTGFTLIELAVVTIVIGIIAAIIIPRFTGTGASKARATALVVFAESAQAIMRSTFSQIGSEINAAGSLTASNMVENTKTWMDVLIYGCAVNAPCDNVGGAISLVKAPYRGRYSLTGSGTLSSGVVVLAPPAAAATGSYAVQGYPTTITAAPPAGLGASSSPRHMFINFANVPDDVTLNLILRMEDELAQGVPAAADTTGPLRFSTSAGGVRTVSIEKEMR